MSIIIDLMGVLYIFDDMKVPPIPFSLNSCAIASLGLVIAVAGCVNVKTEPIRIEPIYIEITVNHKIQKELDNVFADIDAASETADFNPGAAKAK